MTHGKHALPLALLSLLLASCATPAFRSSSLTPMIGRWEGNVETTLASTGATARARTVTVAGWARPDEVMVERTVTRIPGQPSGSAVTTWVRVDELGGWKVYRASSGGIEEAGFATWDPEEAAWIVEARAVDTESGAETSGAGSIRFERPDVRRHVWVVHDAEGELLFRVTGTTERVRRTF